MSLIGDLFKYFGIVGSTVADTPGVTVPNAANLRRARCDAAGHLEVVTAAGALADVNLLQVAGTPTVEGGVAGSQGVGGLAADGVAVAGNPVLVAGQDGANAQSLLTDAAGRLQGDLDRVGGVDVVTGGVAGTQGTGGLASDNAAAAGNPNLVGGLYELAPTARDNNDVASIAVDQYGNQKAVGTQAADAAVDDATFPVKTAAAIRNILVAVTDGRINSLLVDTLGRLWTRSAAFDVLVDADKSATVNPDSANHDAAAQVVCDETNVAAPGANYPSNAGIEIGDRDFLAFTLSLNDVTSVAFEVSNEGTNWYDNTQNLMVDGALGRVNTYFTSAAAVTTLFACDWLRCGYRYIRCAVVVPNATNVFYIDLIQRAL